MNADEVVRAFRICAKHGYCDNCPAYQLDGDCLAPVMIRAADLIESLQARITDLEGQLKTAGQRERNARNELCLKCGRYHEAHNGACDGCRWKEN